MNLRLWTVLSVLVSATPLAAQVATPLATATAPMPRFDNTGVGDTSIFFPKYQVFEVPYVMRDADHFWKFWNGPVGKEINDISLNQRGVMTAGVVYRGARYLTANKPIRTVADLKGLKIRLPENKVWVKIWETLGTLPVVVAFPEVYMALKTGVA